MLQSPFCRLQILAIILLLQDEAAYFAGKETRPSFSSSDGQLPTSRPEGQEPEQQEKNRARLRWTPELHSRFVQAISKLKSAENATPKGILNFMNVEGLTIFHIKSHLQKYRANMRASGGSEAIDSDVETTPKRKSSRSRRLVHLSKGYPYPLSTVASVLRLNYLLELPYFSYPTEVLL